MSAQLDPLTLDIMRANKAAADRVRRSHQAEQGYAFGSLPAEMSYSDMRLRGLLDM